jgi:hypothetical protein
MALRASSSLSHSLEAAAPVRKHKRADICSVMATPTLTRHYSTLGQRLKKSVINRKKPRSSSRFSAIDDPSSSAASSAL